MKQRLAGGGLAAWSIRHPVGVVMLTLAAMVIGAFAATRLSVDLLPSITYPEIRVRVLDPGVPAAVMEDQVTRQLEEQLAITEDAIAVQSRTTEGNSSVDLSFAYGTDIARALQDASTRLDRAKRFLPDSIDPPIIFKFDPSQLPVAEFAISSTRRDAVALRSWVDEVFAKWFLNLPGVAAAEVGGGLVREIQVQPDPLRLAAVGLDVQRLIDILQRANRDEPAGRLQTPSQEYAGRTAGRLRSVAELAALPIPLPDGGTLPLGELAEVLDTHEEERTRTRLDGQSAIKLSVQKQPRANTVAVVDAVNARLDWLRAQGQLPDDIAVRVVSDESLYVRQSLRNAGLAAASGALLAMLVVYLFLGNLRRTLIIGSAIPIGILVTFALLDLFGLTLNIMTLGGLAVGVGMLVDNTIVMLENVHRHQRDNEDALAAGTAAAAEVNSAIVAATSTNLAAVLPFLFIGGLVGLLFSSLIITLSAAMLASLVVALTLVPALATRVPAGGPARFRAHIDARMARLQDAYAARLAPLLDSRGLRGLLIIVFIAALGWSFWTLQSGVAQTFMPDTDDGRVSASITVDTGTPLDRMDAEVARIEELFAAQPDVASQFTVVGGRIFGRTQRETGNRSSINIQLTPLTERARSSRDWVADMERAIADLKLVGVQVRLYAGGLRGVRTGRGDDDISLRIQGDDLDTLKDIGNDILRRLRDVPGLRNLEHSSEEIREELSVMIDRERATALGVDVTGIGRTLRVALEGLVIGDFISGDRGYDLRLRLPRRDTRQIGDLESLVIGVEPVSGRPLHLAEVAEVQLIPAPVEIMRDNQRRVLEVRGSLSAGASLAAVSAAIEQRLADLELPQGYSRYDAGSIQALQAGQRTAGALLLLALFLVFVVMAVQYESLRNPYIILLGVPFALIGVLVGLKLTGLPLSMPVWLGVIMLAGIVVNNAIVLVEYIEILRGRGEVLRDAIIGAARLRLRPILMTTLTTVIGLLPLALGLGEGAELLQPLAVTIVSGLSLSMLVSLVLIPILYLQLARRDTIM